MFKNFNAKIKPNKPIYPIKSTWNDPWIRRKETHSLTLVSITNFGKRFQLYVWQTLERTIQCYPWTYSSSRFKYFSTNCRRRRHSAFHSEGGDPMKSNLTYTWRFRENIMTHLNGLRFLLFWYLRKYLLWEKHSNTIRWLIFFLNFFFYLFFFFLLFSTLEIVDTIDVSTVPIVRT